MYEGGQRAAGRCGRQYIVRKRPQKVAGGSGLEYCLKAARGQLVGVESSIVFMRPEAAGRVGQEQSRRSWKTDGRGIREECL